MLDTSPANILKEVLITLGLGSDYLLRASWPIYVSNEPDTPDNCITIFDTVGRSNGRIMINGQVVNQYGIQVRVRSETYIQGYGKSLTIKNALEKDIYNETVRIGSSSYYTIQSLNQISQVMVLGKELPTSRRSLFTVNGLIVVK